MIKVLVTGAAGQVGQDLMDVLAGITPPGGDVSFQPDGVPVGTDEFSVMGLTHHDLDVTDSQAVHRTVGMVRPDIIIHLAAYTAVDKAESDVETCFAVNEVGTGNLSDAAFELGARLIAVSTDYVYDGLKGDTYVETDATHPIGVYGRSKLAGELRCRPQDTIVRTSWVMGLRGRNVLHVIADRVARNEPVRFVTDQVGTPTFSADLARTLATFARQPLAGIWHVANRGTTSWFTVAETAARAFGAPEGFVTPIVTDELSPTPAAARPPRSDLSTQKWEAADFQPMPEWTDALSRFVADRN
ncbi:MAG: dTDP-4-dehydrorhamnose reductase [Actinobacteria bacterium]|nr:dTDP-4-dehydrorhamnose reductase [Actinomycetota bacterium]